MMSGGANPLLSIGQKAGEQLWSGFPGIMQGLTGNSGRPYEKAGEAYTPYYEKSKEFQNPFFQAGKTGTNKFQDWLSGMQNPSEFINKLMGGYKESPWAKYKQEQAMRAGTNAASASGLIGSTPYLQQSQENASNIAGEDQNNWLQNVLGINTQYGAGQESLMHSGEHAADMLSNIEGNAGNVAGGSAYGEEAGRNLDRNSMWSGIAKLFGG